VGLKCGHSLLPPLKGLGIEVPLLSVPGRVPVGLPDPRPLRCRGNTLVDGDTILSAISEAPRRYEAEGFLVSGC
jgi:hypothetical protein